MRKMQVVGLALLATLCLGTMTGCKELLPEDGDPKVSEIRIQPASGPRSLGYDQEGTVVFYQTLLAGPSCNWNANWRDPDVGEGLVIVSFVNDNVKFEQTVKVKPDTSTFWRERPPYVMSMFSEVDKGVPVYPQTSNTSTEKIKFRHREHRIFLSTWNDMPWEREKTGDFRGTPRIEVLGAGRIGISNTVVERVLTIRNRSEDTPLNVSGVVFSGPGFVLQSGQATSFAVPPKGSRGLVFTVDPATADPYSGATVAIPNNDPKYSSLSLHLLPIRF